MLAPGPSFWPSNAGLLDQISLEFWSQGEQAPVSVDVCGDLHGNDGGM